MTHRPHPHVLDRALRLEAPIDLVFRYLSDSADWASWWGAGSTIAPSPGGRVCIRMPGGVEVTGEVVAVDPPRRLAFTYEYASGTPVGPGGSMVSIYLDAAGEATDLTLSHAFADAAARDAHVQAWRYQLSVLANAIADRAHADAAAVIDRWLAIWSDPDEQTRARGLAEIAAPDVAVRDRVTCLVGLDDLRPHLTAVHRFMPGLRFSRDGEVSQCQGTAVVDWQATVGGQPREHGTAVVELSGRGRIRRVTMIRTGSPAR